MGKAAEDGGEETAIGLIVRAPPAGRAHGGGQEVRSWAKRKETGDCGGENATQLGNGRGGGHGTRVVAYGGSKELK